MLRPTSTARELVPSGGRIFVLCMVGVFFAVFSQVAERFLILADGIDDMGSRRGWRNREGERCVCGCELRLVNNGLAVA